MSVFNQSHSQRVFTPYNPLADLINRTSHRAAAVYVLMARGDAHPSDIADELKLSERTIRNDFNKADQAVQEITAEQADNKSES